MGSIKTGYKRSSTAPVQKKTLRRNIFPEWQSPCDYKNARSIDEPVYNHGDTRFIEKLLFFC